MYLPWKPPQFMSESTPIDTIPTTTLSVMKAMSDLIVKSRVRNFG